MPERTILAAPRRVLRCIVLLGLALLPYAASAATLQANQSLDVSESPQGNAYLAGTEIRVDAPLPADVLAAAADLSVNAPVLGDALLVAGTVGLNAPVTGDVRSAGGRVRIDGDVGGELAVFGGAITVTGKVHEVRVAGGSVELRSGADGDVTVYGGSVSLAGTFTGNVRVVASDHVSLAEGTVIMGTFEYNAPQEAGIPPTAVIEGGANYVGSASFLPTAEEAQTVAIAGLGLFFAVRLVAAILAAGLVAGLFPAFTRALSAQVFDRSFKRSVLLTLLGFSVIVATPVLILLLVVSFVGMGIAALIGALYILLLLLAYLYASVLIGAVFMRTVMKRPEVTWKGAVLGMFLLGLIGIIPIIGSLLAFVLSSLALGAMLVIFYRFAFGKDQELA